MGSHMALDDKKVLLLGIIIFSIAIVGSLIFGENIERYSELQEITFNLSNMEKRVSEPIMIEERADEGSPSTYRPLVDEANVMSISFVLSWSDEANADNRHTNEPDSFTIRIESPDGSYSDDKTEPNAEGGEGNIKLSITLFDEANPPKSLPFLNGTGEWEIILSVAAGDQEPLIPSPFGIRSFEDSGNDFTLEISYDYYTA